jgi:hypothetical protein
MVLGLGDLGGNVGRGNNGAQLVADSVPLSKFPIPDCLSRRSCSSGSKSTHLFFMSRLGHDTPLSRLLAVDLALTISRTTTTLNAIATPPVGR